VKFPGRSRRGGAAERGTPGSSLAERAREILHQSSGSALEAVTGATECNFPTEPVIVPGDLPTGCTLCTLQCLRGFPRVQPENTHLHPHPGTGVNGKWGNTVPVVSDHHSVHTVEGIVDSASHSSAFPGFPVPFSCLHPPWHPREPHCPGCLEKQNPYQFSFIRGSLQDLFGELMVWVPGDCGDEPR
jgi:hypothetical protein